MKSEDIQFRRFREDLRIVGAARLSQWGTKKQLDRAGPRPCGVFGFHDAPVRLLTGPRKPTAEYKSMRPTVKASQSNASTKTSPRPPSPGCLGGPERRWESVTPTVGRDARGRTGLRLLASHNTPEPSAAGAPPRRNWSQKAHMFQPKATAITWHHKGVGHNLHFIT